MFKELTIEEIMKNERLNVTEIALKSGLSIPYISKLKNNRIKASEWAQKCIYEAFGYYVKNELITASNECQKLQYELYKTKVKILKLESENARLRMAIKKCYDSIEEGGKKE